MAVFLGKKPIWPQPFPTLRNYQLYGHHRARRLSQRQRTALAEKLPHLALALAPDDLAREKFDDPAAFFESPIDDLWLEIGFGAGEHLLRMMRRHPKIGFIGCESYLSGIARFVAQLDPQHDKNIRLYHGDARDLLFKLPPQTIGRLFLLYPDPWPKTRHWARRFIQPDIVSLSAQIMKPAAQLHFASDDPVLAAWVLAHMLAHPDFFWLSPESACQPSKSPLQAPPLTRYEAKALAQNRQPTRLVFCRHL